MQAEHYYRLKEKEAEQIRVLPFNIEDSKRQWVIEISGSIMPCFSSRQSDAVEVAKEQAKELNAELIIHNKWGRVRKRMDYSF